eukprot:2914057-Pleurochrysis_carterae.AAC.4
MPYLISRGVEYSLSSPTHKMSSTPLSPTTRALRTSTGTSRQARLIQNRQTHARLCAASCKRASA